MLRLREGQDGDEAFDELVRRNTGKVHGIIYRFLGSGAQVEDLTQEVFLRVYRTASRYVPTAKFSTWLYRVTANLCFNVMRSLRKGRALQVDSRDGTDGDSFFRSLPDGRHAGPHERLDAAELQEKVAAAISNLPGSQKIAIILNKYEDKSYEDISAILQCSAMAVKSLLSRARDNLRQALQEYLHDE